jgi:hypothetical protein
MSQMCGGSILVYALHFAHEPTDSLRLGYASSLSSWSLVNSGTAESGYGATIVTRDARPRRALPPPCTRLHDPMNP